MEGRVHRALNVDKETERAEKEKTRHPRHVACVHPTSGPATNNTDWTQQAVFMMYVQIDTCNTRVHIHSLGQPDPGTLPVPGAIQLPGLIITESNQLVTPVAHGTSHQEGDEHKPLVLILRVVIAIK